MERKWWILVEDSVISDLKETWNADKPQEFKNYRRFEEANTLSLQRNATNVFVFFVTCKSERWFTSDGYFKETSQFGKLLKKFPNCFLVTIGASKSNLQESQFQDKHFDWNDLGSDVNGRFFALKKRIENKIIDVPYSNVDWTKDYVQDHGQQVLYVLPVLLVVLYVLFQQLWICEKASPSVIEPWITRSDSCRLELAKYTKDLCPIRKNTYAEKLHQCSKTLMCSNTVTGCEPLSNDDTFPSQYTRVGEAEAALWSDVKKNLIPLKECRMIEDLDFKTLVRLNVTLSELRTKYDAIELENAKCETHQEQYDRVLQECTFVDEQLKKHKKGLCKFRLSD